MHLDFLHSRRPASAFGWLVLVIGLLVLGALLNWRFMTLAPQLQSTQTEIVRMKRELLPTGPAAARLSDKQLASDWVRAAEVAQELGAPWERLFAVLEGAAEQPVTLLTLEIEGSRRDLVLTGEARNYAALLEYYRYLQQQPMLGSAALQTHQVNRQDRDKPVRFRITARWERAL